jgi:spore coat polysaccharide biosynthesis protein SpsF (cytidylyltransferase family)
MKLLVIVQARARSTRLPGKIFADIAGRTMLEHVLLRARRVGCTVVMAAETYPYLHEEDVLGRFAQVAAKEGPDGANMFMRVTADCPMWDTGLALGVLDRFAAGAWDFVGTSPAFDGLDVEVFSAQAVRQAHYAVAAEPCRDRAHVTPWMRRNLRAEVVELKGGALRWSVDDAGGLEFVRRVFAACELCREGAPHHTNSATSIGGSDRLPVWELHVSTGGGLAECTAFDILKERIGGEPYVSA